MKSRILRNQKGLLTLDFIFALVLVAGFSSILFSISLTLSIVEITQYMTFAAARSYYGGHLTESRQRELASGKFDQLKRNPAIQPFFRSGWFTLGQLQVDDFSLKDPAFAQPADRDTDNFVGARVRLTANVLNIHIPFFGSTTENDQGLSTTIGSYLMREPTFEECVSFNAERYKALLNLNPSYKTGPTGNDDAYKSEMVDNGC